MGQLVATSAKPKRCNINAIQSGGSLASTILAAGEYMLVSSDNSMTSSGNGVFDKYVVGDGVTAASALTIKLIEGTSVIDDEYADLDVADEEGNVLVRLSDGHIKTKNFNSVDVVKEKSDGVFGKGLMIADSEGYVVLELIDGHIRSKNFDSRNISSSVSSSRYEEMVIGTLKKGSIGARNTTPYSSKSLVSDTLGVPYEGARLYISLNADYTITIKGGYINGDQGTTYDTQIGTFAGGDVVNVPRIYSNHTVSYIRLQVQRVDDGNISLTDDIGLAIYYERGYDVVDANASVIDLLQAKACVSGSNNIVAQNGNAIIVHGSDIHGDWIRLRNLYKVANLINADAIVLTGDVVAHNYLDGVTPMTELAKKSSVPTFICTGNHEAGFKYNSSINFEVSDSTLFTYYMSELATTYSYLSASGTTTSVPYYYHDISSKNLRIISVHQYVNGAQTGTSSYRWILHYDQDEITWLCTTLVSTPANYGVILLTHTPEQSMTNGKITGNDSFFQNRYSFSSVSTSVSGTYKYPLTDIIDTFINRGTLSRTYSQGGSPSSFTVSADFSSVPSSVDFIGIMNGHYHQDAVGLVVGASQYQLQMNIASVVSFCGGNVYPHQADKFDCPRNPRSNSSDAFNVCVIDRTNHKVNIYRIGTHRTINDRDRISMSVDYKQ